VDIMSTDGKVPPDDELPPDDRPAAWTSERSLSLANEAMFTIDLQIRRARNREPEDETFAARWWVDLQFLIVALARLEKAGRTASKHGLPETAAPIAEAIDRFSVELEWLRTMRNVVEHADEYAAGEGNNKDVKRGWIHVGSFDGTTFEWLDQKLNIDEAKRAAERLHLAIRSAVKGAIREERLRRWRAMA
jgi:hypothetical protein